MLLQIEPNETQRQKIDVSHARNSAKALSFLPFVQLTFYVLRTSQAWGEFFVSLPALFLQALISHGQAVSKPIFFYAVQKTLWHQ